MNKIKQLLILKSVVNVNSRTMGIKAKIKVTPDESVLNSVDNCEYKPRQHPGIIKPKTILLPEQYIESISNVIQDYPVKALVEDSKRLISHLWGRVPPMEPEELKFNKEKFERKVYEKLTKTMDENNEVISDKFKQIYKDKVKLMLKEKIYNWKPLKYDVYNSLVYLIGLSTAEYSVLTRILSEIKLRDPDFRPRSLCDFGSGVGTVTWAVNNFWKNEIFEYFNVDASSEMNDLAETILKGGRGQGKPLKGTFYRQFLPATNNTYDLVVSAYSMLELPSLKSRLETALNLWNKTKTYLIIVERGTNGGFKVVNEIRDYILQLPSPNTVHVFSPCPHDSACPRFLLNDGTPCNFEINYFSLPINGKSEAKQERFSYVVLKKGCRNKESWPRIVRSTLVRSKHTICRMCTSEGKLDEVIFTASKHGKNCYHCARASKWGDLLPISVSTSYEEK